MSNDLDGGAYDVSQAPTTATDDPPDPTTYTCAACQQTFTRNWTDAEAVAEAVSAFGSFPEDAVLICDDCWRFLRLAQEVVDRGADSRLH